MIAIAIPLVGILWLAFLALAFMFWCEVTKELARRKQPQWWCDYDD